MDISIRDKRLIYKLISKQSFLNLADYTADEAARLLELMLALNTDIQAERLQELEEHTSPPDMPGFLKPEAD